MSARPDRSVPTVPVPLPPADRLPDGFAVRLDPATRVRNGGAALLGGSPLRLMRLAPRARGLLDGDRLVVRDAVTASLAGRLLDANVAVPDLADPAVPDPAVPQSSARPAADAEVTVVVPVRDRTPELTRLLAALRRDPDTRAARLVVVDDGSADAEALVSAARAAGAEVLRHQRAHGPAAARNAGLAAARTHLVAFLDSDCVPRPGWLGPLRRHFADPRLALVAPRIVPLAPATGWLARYDEVAGALDMGERPAAVRPLSAVSYVPSAALLGRRAALGAGFDDAMPVAEDVDLVWRLAGAGWRVRYEPSSEVAHEHPATVTAWLRRRAFYGTGAALLAARHGSAVAPIVVSRWSAVVWALVVAGRGRAAIPALAAAWGLLGLGTVRLARRLAGPGESPPLLLSARLVVGGSGTAGRTLARALARHHWPVALLVATASRRARRGLALAVLAELAAAWWPHRSALDPVRFAGARLLGDLAYGSGLWAGALRAGDLRALLPAEPTGALTGRAPPSSGGNRPEQERCAQ